jgi:peptidoglycan/xylan/chitin deacetylase (PgdA/CDA1 family)
VGVRAIIFSAARSLGLFRATRALFRRQTNVLCFHGFSLGDEHLFRPMLFMRGEVFAKRLEAIGRLGLSVITLDRFVEKRARGELSIDDVVLTIDDGFYSVLAVAAPLLRAHRMPTTLYVTSYYVEHQVPLPHLVIQYAFWKTRQTSMDADGLYAGAPVAVPTKDAGGAAACEALCERAHLQDLPGRVALAEAVCARLGVDYDEIRQSRRLTLMTREELARLADYGIDVQLHTHRHRSPSDERELTEEIGRNRATLRAAARGELRHLCYPSGVWSPAQWAMLANLGLVTAVTCEPGLNSCETPAFGLRRCLDSDDLPEREFEAELTGFKETIRGLRSLTKHQGA